MIDWYLIWLVCGMLTAAYNDEMMRREGCWSYLERCITFTRATLSWPTYLAEDILSWWVSRRDES